MSEFFFILFSERSAWNEILSHMLTSFPGLFLFEIGRSEVGSHDIVLSTTAIKGVVVDGSNVVNRFYFNSVRGGAVAW